ncbi:hypothetical protein D5086_024429 [Populus alba]|uniref:Uncharacterized protein n=1 Tax=Populus alba TaxID=43335 RepID=A0ACC4B667_POPAL
MAAANVIMCQQMTMCAHVAVAVLAGYFAWRTVRSSPEIDDFVSDDSTAEKTSLREKQEFNFKRIIQNGFWVFVDMASGRYLWRNFKEMKKVETLKSL